MSAAPAARPDPAGARRAADARAPAPDHPDHPAGAYLVVAAEPGPARWLAGLLGPRAEVEALDPADAEGLHRRAALRAPAAVLVDFPPGRAEAAAEIVRRLRARHAGLAVLGAGRPGDGAATLAALRAGVADFLVMAPGAEEDARAALRRLAEPRGDRTATHPEAPPRAAGRLALVLGARSGLGASTLATNLVRALRRPAGAAAAPDVALLDLGLPVGDGALYLDAQPAFGFVDAVRDLRRIDRTFVDSALAREPRGAALLPLPGQLARLREVSHGDAVALVRRLRDFFAVQVADLGGFTHADFIAQMAGAAEPDRIWVVCDQGVGAMVSTAALLADLRGRGIATGAMRLVVNRFEPQAGIAAAEIADRLDLPLEAVLPARHAALLGAGLRGEVLCDAAPRDPYARAVAALAESLRPAGGGAGAAADGRGARPGDPASGRRGRIDGLAGRFLGAFHAR